MFGATFQPQQQPQRHAPQADLWRRLMQDVPPHKLSPYRGIPQTLLAMRNAAMGARGEQHVGLVGLVRSIVRGVKAKDYSAEVAAFYHWTCRNFRYVRDMAHVEYVEDPVAFHSRGMHSDCDDCSCWMAAGGMILGNPARFVTAGFKATPEPEMTHVFTELWISRCNQWLTVDPVAGPMTDAMRSAMVWRGVYPLDADMGKVEVFRCR